MTISTDDVRDLLGRDIYDMHGDKVGKVGQVYLDNQTGQPVWATVKTGLFGTKESFVPLEGASRDSSGLRVDTPKDMIKSAPQATDSDQQLSRADEQEIYFHYGRTYPGAPSGRGNEAGYGYGYGYGDGDATGSTHGTQSGVGMDAETGTDRTGTSAGESITRSEERLRVGTETVETGQVRLRKYVVTEEEQVKVPISREEVRVEHEPIRGGEAGQIGEEEQSVTLHAERPVVAKETEAVERVRLQTDAVRDEETVSDQVRRERVEVDDPNDQIRTKDSGQRHK